jgi:hypothetical protein
LPRTSLILTCLAALCASLVLAACGGDDEGGGSSDEDQITETIESSIDSSDPEHCTEYATQAFLEQTELEEGEAAVESCEESARDSSDDVDSIDISDIEVDGSSATASVAFTGGSFDGQTVDVSLVDEDGWKLDRIEAIPDMDPKRFGESYVETATAGDDPLPQEQAQCIGDAFAALPSDELEQLIVEADTDAINELLVPCF